MGSKGRRIHFGRLADEDVLTQLRSSDVYLMEVVIQGASPRGDPAIALGAAFPGMVHGPEDRMRPYTRADDAVRCAIAIGRA